MFDYVMTLRMYLNIDNSRIKTETAKLLCSENLDEGCVQNFQVIWMKNKKVLWNFFLNLSILRKWAIKIERSMRTYPIYGMER